MLNVHHKQQFTSVYLLAHAQPSAALRTGYLVTSHGQDEVLPDTVGALHNLESQTLKLPPATD